MNLTGFIKRLRDIMRNDAGINGDAQRIEQIAWILFLKVYAAKEEDWAFNDDDFVSIIPEPCRWENWARNDDGRGMTGDALLKFVNETLFPTLKTLPVTAKTPVRQSIVRTTFEDANNYMKDGVLLRQVINMIDALDFGDYTELHAFGEIYETILKELQSAGSAGEFYTPRAVTDFMAQMIAPKLGERMADLACGTGGFITSWLKQLHAQKSSAADIEAISNSVYGIEKKQFPCMLCITNLLLHDVDTPNIVHGNSLTLKNVLDYGAADQFDVILMNPPYGGSEKDGVKSFFPANLANSETADLFMSVIMHRLKPGGRAAVILPDGFLFGTDNAKMNIKRKLLRDFNLHTIIRLPDGVFSPYTSITTNVLFFNNDGSTKQTWFYRVDPPANIKKFSKTRPFLFEHMNDAIAWWHNRKEIAIDGFDKAKCFTLDQLENELNLNLDQCGYPHEEARIPELPELLAEFQKKRLELDETIDKITGYIEDILNRS